LETLKHIKSKDENFKEKMRRRWLGEETVVADLPPLGKPY